MSQYKPIYKKLKENSERFRASEAEILRNGKAGIQRKPSKTAPLKGVQKKLNKKLKKLEHCNIKCNERDFKNFSVAFFLCNYKALGVIMQ